MLDLILTNQPDNAVTHVLEESSDRRAVHCSLSIPLSDKSVTTKPILIYTRVEKMNGTLAEFQ